MGHIIDEMPERYRDVFFRRIGVKNGRPETLNEIATVYCITRERVRQLEIKAMAYLQRHYSLLDEKINFMKKWQEASSVKLAAKAAGISYSYATLMSKRFRKDGIPLKIFPHAIKHLPAVLTDDMRSAIDPEFKKRVERDKRFIELWNAGVKSKDICKEMGWGAQTSVNAKAGQMRAAGHHMVVRRRPSVRRVNNEEFVRTWQQSSSVREVAEKTEMSVQAVNARACSLRRKGVPLKSMAMRDKLTPSLIERLKVVAREALAVVGGR